MSIVKGENVVLLQWDADILAWLPFACARSCSLNVVTDVLEVSLTGSGKFRDFIPVANSFTGTLEGVMNLYKANSYVISDMRRNQIEHNKILLRWERTDTDGHIYTDEGYCFFVGTSDVASFDNISTFNVDIQGTGILTQVFTPSPKTNSIVYSLYYPSDGSGETSFTDTDLIGVTVIGAWLQTDFTVITSGTVLYNEIKHDSLTGAMSWAIPMDADQTWHIQYQIVYEGS